MAKKRRRHPNRPDRSSRLDRSPVFSDEDLFFERDGKKREWMRKQNEWWEVEVEEERRRKYMKGLGY